MKTILSLGLISVGVSVVLADDWTQWGGTPQRNMVSSGVGAPESWDVESGKNIKWIAHVGSQSYGNPIIAGGLVIAGTNNEGKRDPRYTADGGVLMIFSEKDGKFLWQQYHAKLKSGRVNDWPYQGVCSTPYTEGDFLWYCTNRAEVICLDLSPLRQGKGEPTDVWRFDLMGKLGVFPHNMVSCSITAYEDLIYVITGNGVDDTHKNVPAPTAPAIVCFEKKTGRVVWHDSAPKSNILHGQWASPAIAIINGRAQVVCPLGDSWVYSYDARTGKLIWKFDTNRKDTLYPTTRNEIISTPVIYENRMYIATGQDPEHGEGPGTLWCVDITREGDLSLEVLDKTTSQGEAAIGLQPRKGKPNSNSGVVWFFEKFDADGDGKFSGKERMHRSISTVAIHDGLVYIPDFSGFLHCLDAKTGKHYWTYDMEAAMWGSPLAVDGKVYLCDEDGDVAVFKAGKELKVLGTYNLGSAAYCTPVFANGVLYLMSKDKIFAIKK